MSHDELVSLFHASSFVILTHLPATVLFQLSLDSYAWTLRSPSASGALGVKLIPPHGVHVLSLGIEGGPLTTSFLWSSQGPSILVLKYDPDVEDWHVVPSTHDWVDKLQGIDPLLVPYPRLEVTKSQETEYKSNNWNKLTCWVTNNVLQNTLSKAGTGLSGSDWSNLFTVYKVSSQTSSHYSEPKQCSSSPSSSPSVSGVIEQDWIHFPVYHLKPSRSAFPPLTIQALDKSHILDRIVDASGSETYLLGEWQLAFLLLLKCSNIEGLDHWKVMFELFTHCRVALSQRWQLFIDWMTTLKVQLLEMSKADADMILGDQNFIACYLSELFCTMEEQAEECTDDLTSLLLESNRLQAALQNHFDWPLSRLRVEKDDEQPVMVDPDVDVDVGVD